MRMHLTLRLFIFLSGLTILTILCLYTISQLILIPSFKKLEQDRADRNIKRIEQAISAEVNNLDALDSDWSFWDDAYNFAKDKNQEFIDSNLNDDWFGKSSINHIIVASTSSTIIYSKSFDPENKSDSQIPVSLKNQIEKPDGLTKFKDLEDSHKGLIVADNKILFISSHPITKSIPDGTTTGTLIMVREINEAILKKINNTTLFESDIVPVNNDNTKEFRKYAIYSENNKTRTFENNGYISGMSYYYDLNNQPTIFMRTKIKEDILEQGTGSMNKLVLYLSILNSTVILLTLIFTMVNIVYPLNRMIKDIAGISLTQDPNSHVTVWGLSEISELARKINEMIDTIRQSSQDLKIKTEDLEKSRNEFKSKAEELEKFNKLTIERELKMVELKKEIEALRHG